MSNKKILLLILVIVGTVFLSLGIPFSVLLYLAIEERQDKNDFLANGKRGTAKVLGISEDTRYKRDQAILVLEVSVPNYQTYQTRVSKTILPIHAPRVQPGAIIDVLVDPEQPNNSKRVLLLLEENTLEKERNRR